jgi:hypothetical protein
MTGSNNLSELTDTAAARTNLGLSNVNNTADSAKPVSTPQAAAIAATKNVEYDTYTTPEDAWLSGVNIKGDTSVNINTFEAACTRIGDLVNISIYIVLDGFSVTAYDDSTTIFNLDIASIGADAGWFTAIESEAKLPVYAEWDAASGDYPPWVARGHMDDVGSLQVFAGDTQFGYPAATATLIKLSFNLTAKVSGDWTAT